MIKVEKPIGEPLPGFYEAVFKKSCKAIFARSSMTTLIFLMLMITLKFFTAHLNVVLAIPCRSGGTVDLPILIGFSIKMIVWGAILFCYSGIICATSFDTEPLPVIEFGGFFGFFAEVVKSIYTFVIAGLGVMAPAAIVNYVLNKFGVTAQWPLLPFIFLAMFIMPMAVLTAGVTKDLTRLFQIHKFAAPIKKAFKPYLLVAAIFAAAVSAQYYSLNYGHVRDLGGGIILSHLFVNLAIQILLVFAMRTLGLFHRHYDGYFEW